MQRARKGVGLTRAAGLLESHAPIGLVARLTVQIRVAIPATILAGIAQW